MTRAAFILCAFAAVAACSDQEAGQSEYFATINTPPPSPPSVTLQSPATPVTIGELRGSIRGNDPSPLTGDAALVDSLNAAIANAGRPTVTPTATPAPAAPAPAPTATVAPSDSAPAAPAIDLPTESENISDNSFQRVVNQETIETDRQKLAELEKRRVELQAEPLPARAADVNLAAFARSTDHKIGDRIYRRSGTRSSSRAASECRKYRNPDEAQRAFIASGGPENDPNRIDPDGDGFVCGWSPLPFRSLNLPG